MSTHTGTGVSTAKGGGSGSRYWTQHLFDTDDLAIRYLENSRSGLTIADSLSTPVNDASIYLPHLNMNTGSLYAYVNDNGGLDVAANDFTLCGWFKNLMGNKSAYYYAAGKYVAASVIGRYGIYVNQTTGYWGAAAQSSGGTVSVNSTIDSTVAGWAFILIEVDQTNKKFRLFINNTQIGTDQSWTGSFSATGNNYRFYIGASNTNITGAATGITQVAAASVRVYHSLLNPTQKTTLYNQGHVSGTFAHWPLNDINFYDINGAYHLTGYGITRSHLAYGVNGSRQALDLGYSKYTLNKNKEIQVPYVDTSTASSVTPAGYIDEGDIVGISNGHNLADSYIILPTGIIDRSNTTQCAYPARLTTLQNYYDVNYKGGLNALELPNWNLSNYFNDDYRGKIFSKISSNKLKELFIYNTNKTGEDYHKVIKYTQETGILTFTATTDTHICATKGSKVLKFDDTHTLSLSTDGGATYPTTLVTTLSQVAYAFIFESGNIYFFDDTKGYYSFDNLATYHELTVKGIDGNDYVAGTGHNFRTYGGDFDEVTAGSKKVHFWGPYVTSGTAESDNVNIWGLIDGQTTLKSYYKFGVSNPSAVCRHVHQVTYDTFVQKWYIITGDADADHNNFMRFTYDSDSDAITAEIIGKGDGSSIWENGGMAFDETHFYFSGEDNADRGPKSSLKSDIANIATNQKLLFAPDRAAIWYGIRDGYFILTEGGINGSSHITFTADQVKFFTREFTQITPLVPYGCYLCIGKLSSGYFVFQCIENGETMENFTKGTTLLVKPTILQ